MIWAADLDRSPIALTVSQDQSVCLTANHTSNSVSLVDLASGRVLDELAVGRGPADLAWITETTAIVSLLHDDALVEVSRTGNSLKLVRKIPVGDEPRGLALSKDRKTVYVALGGDDAVAMIDLTAKSDVAIPRLPTSGIPKTVRISPDGRWLITCTAVPATVYVHDLDTKQLVSERRLFDGAFNPGVPTVTRDSQLLIMPHAVNREFSVTAQMIDIGWVIDNRISKLPLPDGEPSSQKQLGLDIRGQAVGDAYAAAFSPDESRLMVTCGGDSRVAGHRLPLDSVAEGGPGRFSASRHAKGQVQVSPDQVGGTPAGNQRAG